MEPVNRAVLSFLKDAVAGSQKLSSTELQEFDDCRYTCALYQAVGEAMRLGKVREIQGGARHAETVPRSMLIPISLMQ